MLYIYICILKKNQISLLLTSYMNISFILNFSSLYIYFIYLFLFYINFSFFKKLKKKKKSKNQSQNQ